MPKRRVLAFLSCHSRAALLISLGVALFIGCNRRVADYELPSNVQVVDGMPYVILKQGRGRPAMEGSIWGVETTLLSHMEANCDYPCKHFMTYPRLSKTFEPWNPLLRTMREGEVRRVWLTTGKRGGPFVYDVRLALVVLVDSQGEPIPENE